MRPIVEVASHTRHGRVAASKIANSGSQLMPTYSHPPGVIRALGLGSWGFAFADKITLDLPPMNWIEYSTQAAAVVERSMQNLGNPFVLTELANFFPDGFVDYVRQRLARWAKIRPGLEPHTLGQGRLAPPQEPPA